MEGISAAHMLVLWLIGANVAAFVAMVVDKESARAGTWRISENTLILLSFIGGSLGALLASRLVRHKTRKQPIASILTFMPVLHLGIGLFWASGIIYPIYPASALP